MAEPRVKVGVINAAHGVRGQVKIYSLSEDPEDLLEYSPLTDASGKREFRLTRHGAKGAQLIASIHGITDRNEAEKLKGTELYAAPRATPNNDNEFHYSQLIGLEAYTSGNTHYGTVIDIYNFGAGDILELELTGGGKEMLPFTGAFFGNITNGRIAITPPNYIEPPEDSDKEPG